MKEHPIIFSTPMVKAILDGKKTMTRRVIKLNYAGRVQYKHHQWHIEDSNAISGCPYGQPGDTLWVRESYVPDPPNDDTWDYVGYANSYPLNVRAIPERYRNPRYCLYKADYGNQFKSLPSIHMPRWAFRTALQIKSIKVERVQDISEDDAIAEGTETDPKQWDACYVDGFIRLWDFINSKRGYGWDVNPWVWVIEFERIK